MSSSFAVFNLFFIDNLDAWFKAFDKQVTGAWKRNLRLTGKILPGSLEHKTYSIFVLRLTYWILFKTNLGLE